MDQEERLPKVLHLQVPTSAHLTAIWDAMLNFHFNALQLHTDYTSSTPREKKREEKREQ